MSLLSSVGCALRPRAHDLRNRLRRSAGTLSPIPQGRRRSHVTSARSRLRSDPGGYAGSRPARGRWARDAGGALAGWPPARLDRPSGREDLAGVLEEDHPVAQQAPALVRVRPHHARGVPVWCVRRRADGLVLALATGAGDGAAARRVVTRRRGGAVDRGWGDHGVASGGARPRRLLRKTHLHGQQTLRLPVTAVTTTCCLRARRVCMGSFKLPRSRTDRGGPNVTHRARLPEGIAESTTFCSQRGDHGEGGRSAPVPARRRRSDRPSPGTSARARCPSDPAAWPGLPAAARIQSTRSPRVMDVWRQQGSGRNGRLGHQPRP